MQESNVWMLCYWLKCTNRKLKSDEEILEEGMAIYLRLKKDSGRSVKHKNDLVGRSARAKYQGCAYADVEFSFFDPIKYGYY